jgi:hypothetical protein
LFFQNTFKQNQHCNLLTNFYLGLSRGPIDHQSSSVINTISEDVISMGSAVIVVAPPAAELLPRVQESPAAVTSDNYGIAVGGDIDGVYGTGAAAADVSTKAANGAGEGVVVVTQGRCLARVESTAEILVGSPLGASAVGVGLLELANDVTQFIIARALQPIAAGVGQHIIAVDVQREGLNT